MTYLCKYVKYDIYFSLWDMLKRLPMYLHHVYHAACTLQNNWSGHFERVPEIAFHINLLSLHWWCVAWSCSNWKLEFQLRKLYGCFCKALSSQHIISISLSLECHGEADGWPPLVEPGWWRWQEPLGVWSQEGKDLPFITDFLFPCVKKKTHTDEAQVALCRKTYSIHFLGLNRRQVKFCFFKFLGICSKEESHIRSRVQNLLVRPDHVPFALGHLCFQRPVFLQSEVAGEFSNWLPGRYLATLIPVDAGCNEVSGLFCVFHRQ